MAGSQDSVCAELIPVNQESSSGATTNEVFFNEIFAVPKQAALSC